MIFDISRFPLSIFSHYIHYISHDILSSYDIFRRSHNNYLLGNSSLSTWKVPRRYCDDAGIIETLDNGFTTAGVITSNG